MNIIVFGGAGFLGSHIAEQLKISGHQVSIFDVNEPASDIGCDRYIKGDILNYDDVLNAVQGCDVVYNYAGLSDLNDGVYRPLDTISLNIYGNANIMQACINVKVKRFIYASSIYVYSQKGGFYRCSKQASEIYLEEYNRIHGLKYTVLRYGTLYGPRADDHNSIYRYLKQALASREIVCSNPDEIREYIHVRDAAKLSVEALDQQYENTRLILSGHYNMKVADMLSIVKEIFNDEIDIVYEKLENKSDHYSYTPYSFSPKIGQKLVSNIYTDIGQGLLECIEDIYKNSDYKKFNDITELK